MKVLKVSISKFYLIYIYLCAPFFINAQIHVGDSLFNNEQWLAARVAYERALYQGVTSIDQYNTLLLKKALCFKAEKNFDAAYQVLVKSSFYEGSDSIKLLLYYEAALNAYLSNKPDISIGLIQEQSFYLQDTDQKNQLLFLEIIALNEMQQWQEAEKSFLLYTQINRLDNTEGIYDEILNYKFKKIKKAENLSYILPGVGQMYAGYPLRGLLSGAIQGGLVYLSLSSFLNGYYFSGTFTGVALFYMFYNGGARYASKLATRNNEEKVAEFNTKIKEILIENERIKKGG
jgi:hypothetical protein